MLSIMLPVKSRLLVVKIHQFLTVQGSAPSNHTLVQWSENINVKNRQFPTKFKDTKHTTRNQNGNITAQIKIISAFGG